MQVNIITLYGLVALIVFLVLLVALLLDSTTSKTDWISWCIVAIAALAWPLAVPLSLIEVSRKILRRKQSMSESERSHLGQS
jgi:hypothetical protein